MQTDSNSYVLTGPSHVVMYQIAFQSTLCTEIAASFASINDEIKAATDDVKVLELNNRLLLQKQRLETLVKYILRILETFRTFPLRSERLRRAEELFYQGKLEEMDELLDFEEIKQEVETLCNNVPPDEAGNRANYKRRSELAGELVIKSLYRHTFIQDPDWYKMAYECLYLAHKAQPLCPHAVYEFAIYLLATKDYKEYAVEELLEGADCLTYKLSEEAKDRYRAQVSSALSSYYFEKKEYDKCIEYDTKVVDIYTELSGKDPAEYRTHLAEAIKHLAMSNVNAGKYSVALIQFEEMLRLQREMAAQSGNNFPFRMNLSDFEQFGDFQGEFSAQINMADTLTYLARVHQALEEFPQALERYDEAIQILNARMDDNIFLVLDQKADILYDIAELHYGRKEFETALRRLKEGLACRKRLQEIDPFGQFQGILHLRELMKDTYFHLRCPNEAIHEQEKIIKICRIMVKNDRNEHNLDNLAYALGILIEYCQKLHKWDKFIAAVYETESIYRQLIAEFDPEYKGALGDTLTGITSYYANVLKEPEKGLASAREACEILETIERDERMEENYQHMLKLLEKK
jgi:tetratricopeptide (TPR) repeat protein